MNQTSLSERINIELQNLNSENEFQRKDALYYFNHNCKTKQLSIYQNMMYLLLSNQNLNPESLEKVFKILKKAIKNIYSKLNINEKEIKKLIIDSVKAMSEIVKYQNYVKFLNIIGDLVGCILEIYCKSNPLFTWKVFWPEILLSFALIENQHKKIYISACFSLLLNLNRFYYNLGVFSDLNIKNILLETLNQPDLFLISLNVLQSIVINGPVNTSNKFGELCPIILEIAFGILQREDYKLFSQSLELLQIISIKAKFFFEPYFGKIIKFCLVCRNLIKHDHQNILKANILLFANHCSSQLVLQINYEFHVQKNKKGKLF